LKSPFGRRDKITRTVIEGTTASKLLNTSVVSDDDLCSKSGISKTVQARSLEVPSTPTRQLEERRGSIAVCHSVAIAMVDKRGSNIAASWTDALNHVMSGEYEGIPSYRMAERDLEGAIIFPTQ